VPNLVCQAFFWVFKAVCTITTWFVYLFCVNGGVGAAFLLTDGSIFLNEASGLGTRRWWKLTPDAAGRYERGTWVRRADSINARLYFASAVLADGRFVVVGGEYSDASGTMALDRTTRCEVYDPVTNRWTSFGPPTGLSMIGDAACCMLADGRLLIGDLSGTGTFTLNPVTLQWSPPDRNSAVHPRSRGY
jgi:hypothetical protein